MPSLRSIASVIAPLLFAPAVHAAQVSPVTAGRYSISGAVSPPIQSGFTLLEPAWLLPPIASLDAAAQLGGDAGRADVLLREDAVLGVGSVPVRSPTGEPFAYSLSDKLTAQFRYRHPQMFGFSRSETVRDDSTSAFATRADRDVIDLNMSWRLAGSTLGLGYQLQSSGHPASGVGDGGLSRFMPGSAQAVQAVSLGFTREWGSAPSLPAHVVAPPLLDDSYSAVSLLAEAPPPADTTPTPTP